MPAAASTSSSARLTARLDGWADGRGPLFRSLAEALQRLIQAGELAPGARLPAERDLSRSLAVSRTTVVAAYDLVAAQGLLTRRQGSGTFVLAPSRAADGGTLVAGYADKAGANPLFRGMGEPGSSTIDFSLAAPQTAGPFLSEALAVEAGQLLDAADGHGFLAAGLPVLRRAIADQLSRDGLPTTSAQVMVTSGAQQALRLLAALYLRAGDSVIVEQPTYPGALEAFRAEGARMLPVNVDAGGVPPEAIERLLARTPARLVHLTPTVNNPTGALMPAARRRQLAEIAVRYQVPLVEDTTLVDLGPPDAPPSIASFADGACVLTIGSLSKLFWGGLRVGWVRAPELVIERLSRMRAATDLASSALGQIVGARLLEHRDAQRAWRRTELGNQLDTLSGSLCERLPEWEVQQPQGGLTLWVRLPGGSASAFARLALRYGVVVVPGPVFAVDGSFDDRLRLPFTLAAPRLAEGVRRLAVVWEAYTAAGQPRRTAPPAVV